MQFWLRALQPAYQPAHVAWQEQIDALCRFDRNMPIPSGGAALGATWYDGLLTRALRISYRVGVFDNAGALAGPCGLQGIHCTNGDAVLLYLALLAMPPASGLLL